MLKSFSMVGHLEGSRWSSPTIISSILFVGGNLVWYCAETYFKNSKQNQDADDSAENNGDLVADERESSSYTRKRSERRLSFPIFPLPANQSEPEFYPKNSNWTHFESLSEPNEGLVEKSTRLVPKRDDTQTSIELHTGSKMCHDHCGGKLAAGVSMTLEGDSAACRAWNISSKSSNSHHRRVSDDEEGTTDGEDSQTSRYHFVWTDDLELRAKKRQSEFKASSPQGSVNGEDEGYGGSDIDTSGDENTNGPGAPISQPKHPRHAPLSEHRVNYNARIMPHKLILIRHGQSLGNIDETLYCRTPDNVIPLTDLGWEQARLAGKRLRQIVNGSSDVYFIVSPYVRTVETFHGIASAWSDPESEFSHLTDPLKRRKAWYGKLVNMGLSWAEDPRIREQDFGNLQDPALIKKAKLERKQFGAFYYRFAHGESAADVFDRTSTFLDSLWRSFDAHPSRYYVLVTHGISIRVLLARYFRYTIDQFHLLSNPLNCEMIVLTHDGRGRLQMSGRHELHSIRVRATNELVMRYKYHKRLRVIPPEQVRKVKVRICQSEKYNDQEEEDSVLPQQK